MPDRQAPPVKTPPSDSLGVPSERASPVFMNVKQLAGYLQINEKKIYALANEGRLPGTKITGKWLFPKALIDHWLLESSHGGLLTDRLVIAGSDDPLLSRLIADLTNELDSMALISHTTTGTLAGLDLLARRRIDVCCLHWGPVAESARRHASLLRNHPESSQWLIVRFCQREQGLMLAPPLDERNPDLAELFAHRWRWVLPREGSGSRQFLQVIAASRALDMQRLNITTTPQTERELASLIARNQADIAPGPRSIANEFGLHFIPTGWEGFDLVLTRGVYFRHLFQALINGLRRPNMLAMARQLGGYRFTELGQIIWSS